MLLKQFNVFYIMPLLVNTSQRNLLFKPILRMAVFYILPYFDEFILIKTKGLDN